MPEGHGIERFGGEGGSDGGVTVTCQGPRHVPKELKQQKRRDEKMS